MTGRIHLSWMFLNVFFVFNFFFFFLIWCKKKKNTIDFFQDSLVNPKIRVNEQKHKHYQYICELALSCLVWFELALCFIVLHCLCVCVLALSCIVCCVGLVLRGLVCLAWFDFVYPCLTWFDLILPCLAWVGLVSSCLVWFGNNIITKINNHILRLSSVQIRHFLQTTL